MKSLAAIANQGTNWSYRALLTASNHSFTYRSHPQPPSPSRFHLTKMSGILNRPDATTDDMSYADAAARGPKQTDAEKMPDVVPEILHEDSGVHSLDSLNSSTSSNNTIPSYADQQLAHERAEQAERNTEQAADEIAKEAKEFTRKAEEDLARLEKQTEKKAQKFESEVKESYSSFKDQAGKTYENVKKEAKTDGKKAKQEAKDAEEWADKNKGNPVVVGNAVAIAAIGGLLGIGAYRMHQQGTLTWKVAGLWADSTTLQLYRYQNTVVIPRGRQTWLLPSISGFEDDSTIHFLRLCSNACAVLQLSDMDLSLPRPSRSVTVNDDFDTACEDDNAIRRLACRETRPKVKNVASHFHSKVLQQDCALVTITLLNP
nr:hypothetical protein CFP56_64780 [Quercus suber]